MRFYIKDIDTALGKVKSRIQRIDEDILREVRTQSRVGTKAKTELNSAQGSITVCQEEDARAEGRRRNGKEEG